MHYVVYPSTANARMRSQSGRHEEWVRDDLLTAPELRELATATRKTCDDRLAQDDSDDDSSDSWDEECAVEEEEPQLRLAAPKHPDWGVPEPSPALGVGWQTQTSARGRKRHVSPAGITFYSAKKAREFAAGAAAASTSAHVARPELARPEFPEARRPQSRARVGLTQTPERDSTP